jgi:hypothetical protein
MEQIGDSEVILHTELRKGKRRMEVQDIKLPKAEDAYTISLNGGEIIPSIPRMDQVKQITSSDGRGICRSLVF